MRLVRGRAASQDLASVIFGRAKEFDAVKMANCNGSAMAPTWRAEGRWGTTAALVASAYGRVATVAAAWVASSGTECAVDGAGAGAGAVARLEGSESPELEEFADVDVAGWAVMDEVAEGGTAGTSWDPP